MRQRPMAGHRPPVQGENRVRARPTPPLVVGTPAEGAAPRQPRQQVGPLRAFSHRRHRRDGFTGQCLWRLAPPPLSVENLGAAGLTPARLGPEEAVGQCGAGACGTVDCCHERESQTHIWEAPPGGRHRPFDQGVRRPQLTIEHAPFRPAGRQVRFRVLGWLVGLMGIHKPGWRQWIARFGPLRAAAHARVYARTIVSH